MEEVIKEELVQNGHFKYLHVHNELGMWPSIHVCMYHFCHVSHSLRTISHMLLLSWVCQKVIKPGLVKGDHRSLIFLQVRDMNRGICGW